MRIIFFLRKIQIIEKEAKFMGDSHVRDVERLIKKTESYK